MPGNQMVNDMARTLIHAVSPLPVLFDLSDEKETDLVNHNHTKRLERQDSESFSHQTRI